jgi:hypothetical protein
MKRKTLLSRRKMRNCVLWVSNNTEVLEFSRFPWIPLMNITFIFTNLNGFSFPLLLYTIDPKVHSHLRYTIDYTPESNWIIMRIDEWQLIWTHVSDDSSWGTPSRGSKEPSENNYLCPSRVWTSMILSSRNLVASEYHESRPSAHLNSILINQMKGFRTT